MSKPKRDALSDDDLVRLRAILAAAPCLDAQQTAAAREIATRRAVPTMTAERAREVAAIEARHALAADPDVGIDAQDAHEDRGTLLAWVREPTPPRALTEAEARAWAARAYPQILHAGHRQNVIAALLLAASRGDVPPEVRPTCHGCWTGGEDLHARTEQCSGARPETPEMAVTTGEDAPWTPKPGDRVRTADELTAVGYGPGYCRLPGIAGALTEEHSEGGWWVRHDDGPEAPYDTDELRPAPAGVPSIAGPAGLDAARKAGGGR